MNSSRATLLAGLLLVSAPAVLALPEGPAVQSGTVRTQSAPGSMTIQQLTDKAIINWNSFNIGTNELLRVLQPNQAAILLNRVVGQDPSVILGQLQANGNIWLLNPNGILFGAGARVDVGGLLATTLNIQDKDFLAGRYDFHQLADKPLSAVINQGELTVSPQGYVILSAPLVSNEGLIVANLGKVALVSGQHTTLSFDTKGLINYQLATAQASAGPVLLTPDMVSEVIRGVVQTGGIREGNLITQQDGRILLTNGEGATINAGDIRAAGGSVTLDSNKATLLRPGSLISVSGDNAFVDAGQIKVLSQSATWAQPNSRLEASSATGKGGFIEVSGKAVSVGSTIDVHGATQNGKFYLDPDFLRIIAGLSGSGDLDGLNPITAADAPGTASTVTTGWLESLVDTDISLEASNSVTVANGADFTLNNSSLNITAISGNITFENPATTITTRQDVTFTAGNNIDVGTIVITPGGGRGFGGAVNLTAGNSVNLLNGGQITSQGGLSITATAGNITFQNASTPVSSNFAINFQAGNDITLSNMTNSAFVDVNVTAGHDILVPSGASSSLTNAQIVLDAGNNVTFADGNTQLQADTLSITLNAGNEIQLGRLSADSIIINASNGVQSAPGLLPGNSNLQAFSPPAPVNVGLTSENGSVNLSINQLGNLNLNAGNATLQNQGDLVTLGAVNVTNDFRLDNQGQVALDSVELRQAGQNFVINASSNISFDVGQGGTQIQGSTVLLFTGNDISTTGFGEGFSPAINATNVGLSAGGSIYSQIQVSATNVAVSAGTGDIDFFFVNDVNVASVGGINGVNGTGLVILDTLGNLTMSAPVVGNDVNLLANGDIQQVGPGLGVQAGNLTIAGSSIGTAATPIQIDVSFLSAESDTGDIFLADGLAADTHPNLTLLSDIGGPLLSGGLFSSVGVVNLTTVGNLAVNDIVRGANVSLQATGSIDIADLGESAVILAPEQVSLWAGGDINASGGFGISVSATQLTVSAGGSIFLTGDVVQLSAQAGNEILFDNFAPSLSVFSINSTSGNVDFTSSGTISLDGTVQAAGAVNILAFDQITQTAGNVIAGTTIDVDTSGNLSSVPGSQFQGAEIALNANDISGLTVQTPLLAAQASDRIQIQANGSVEVGNVGVVEGLSAPAQVSLTSSGNLTVSSNVTATDVNLISSNGLLDVPGNVSASGVLDLQANNGSIQLQTASTGAGHALLSAIQNITGLGGGPQLLANNISVNTGNVSLGLTSPGLGPVSLQVNAIQDAVINSSSSLQVFNPSSAGGDLQLSTDGDMALSGTLSAGNTVALNVTGDLNVAAAAPTFQANALSLQVGTVSGSPITTNVSQLAAFSPSSLSLNQTSATPLTVSVVNGVIGLSSFSGVNLTTQGPLNVDAGISGTGINLVSSAGDVNLNAPLVTSGLVTVNAQGGNLTLNSLVQGSAAQLSSSANLSGPGFVAADLIRLTSGNDTSVNVGAPAPGTVFLRYNAGTNAIISSTDSVNLNAASTAANDAQLAVTGNLTINSRMTVANTVALNVTGELTSSGFPNIEANALSLRVGNLTSPLSFDVSEIAATSGGNLNLDQTSETPLTVTSVNGVNGLTSPLAVNLTSNGPITVASPVSGDSVRLVAANLNVNSTINAATLANVVTIAGDLNVDGAVNASTVNLTSSNALDVNAGLTGNAINVRAANISLDAPVNAVTLANVVTNSGALDVNSTVQGDIVRLVSAAGLGVDGAVNGTNVLLSGQSQLVVNGGVNATNANLTAVSGPLNVNADVLASNATLLSNNANMSINATVQGSNLAQATAQNGNISLSGNLVGANAMVNASGNVSGPGSVSSNNASLTAGTDITSVALAGLAAGNIDLDLNAGGNAQLSSANSVNLVSSSVTNSLDLAVTGDLNLNGQLSVGNTLTLNISNSLSNTTGSPSLQADALSLTVGSVAAPALVTNVNQLAAQSSGDLNITNLSPNLQVGNVSGLAGVNATNLNLNTSGNLAVSDSIQSSGNTAVNALGDVDIAGNVSAGNQVLLTANNLTGSGAGVHVIGGEVGLSAASIGPLTVSAPLLAASSGSNLTISAVGDVAVGTVGALSGLNTVNNITLDTPGGLAVNAPINGDQVALSAASINLNSSLSATTLANVVTSVGDLSVNGAVNAGTVNLTSAAALGVIGAINGSNVNLSSQNLLSVNAGINASNANLTAASGGISANADILASSTSLVANNGDISLNATVQGSNVAQVNAQNGNVSIGGNLVGANAVVNASANLTGPGTVTSNNVSLTAGNDITALALAGLAAGNINLTFTAGSSAQITSANSVSLGSSSVGNDLLLAVTGNLALSSPLSGGNTLALNITGDLENGGGAPSFQANALSLRVGNTTSAPITTNVSLIAASSGGDLNIDQTSTTPIAVTSVNGVIGLNSPGALNLSAQGPLTVSSPVSGGSVRLSAANINLNSTLDAVTLANVATTAGDLNVNGAVSGSTVNLTSVASLDVNGAINGTDVNLSSQNLLTVTAGINATNANLTAATGGINASADILASNTSLVANSGDISLSSTVQGSNLAVVNAQNGNISLNGNLVGGNVVANTSANLTGPGFVTSNNVSLSAGNDITSVALAGLAAGNVDLNFTAGGSAQLTSANSVNLNGSSSVGNDLNLAVTGNLTLNNQLSAGNTLTLNVSNDLANSAASPSLQANALSLRVGNITGQALTTNVTQLAAQSFGDLNVTNLSPNLQVGNVSGLSGVSATNVNLNTSGNLAVSDSIQSGGNTGLNALGDIDIAGNVSAGNQVLITANNLTGSGAGVHVIGGEVGLSAASIGPLTVSTPLLAASSSSNLTISAVGDVAVGTVGALSGLNAVNNIMLDTPGALAVNAPVNGDQVALSAANINLNSSLNATTLANVVTSSGDLNVNGAVNAGTVNLTSAASLDVNASLTSGSAINLSGTNISLDAPVNAVTLVNALTSSGDLNVNSTVQGGTVNLTSAAALGVNGAINGSGVNLSSQNLLSVNAGINASNANLTAASGGISANADILASSTSLVANNGDISLNATVQGSNVAQVNAQNGNVSISGNLVGANALVNASANLTGPGTVTSNNVSLTAGNDITNVALAGLFAGNVNLAFSAGGSAQVTSANSVNLGSSSVGNDLQLAVTGNLALSSPLSGGNTLALNVTGDLDNAGGAPSFQANALSLRVGNTTGAPITTNVSRLAATSGGDLSINQAATTPLTVTTVNGVTGLSSPGALNLSAQGPLTVSSPVSGGSVRLSAANINLNSTLDAVTLANVATSAGDLNVNGAVSGSTVNLTSAASLDVNADLTSSGAINLSGTNISLDAPVNAVTLVNAVSSSGDLNVNGAVSGSTVNLISAASLGVNGAISGTDVNLSSQNLLSVNAGVNATNANLNAATGGININADVLASNTSLTANSGDISLNATVQGSNLAQVNAQNGNVSLSGNLVGANAVVNSSANLTGPGTVTSSNVSLTAGNEINNLALAGLAAGNVDLTFTAGGSAQITSANSVSLGSTSVGNDLQLAVSGNLALSSPLSGGNTLALNVTGDLENSAGAPSFQANSLSLRVGNTTGTPITTNVSQLAASSGGDLSINQAATTQLTVTSVNGVTGLSSPGALNLSAQGPLTVSSAVSGGSVRLSAASINLNSTLDAVTLANVATTAGDLNVNGAVSGSTVNLTAATGGMNVNADVLASNASLLATSGDLTINATVAGSSVAQANTQNGGIRLSGNLVGANALVNSSANVTGPGTVTSSNVSLTAGNDINNVALAGLAAGNVDLTFTAGGSAQITSANSVSLGSSSVGNDLQLAVSGNLALSSPLSGGNTLALNVTGDLENSAGAPSFQANALSLRVGNITGAPITTNVSQLAANSGGDLSINQAATTQLTVTSVNGLTGLSSPGALNLSAQGPLTVNSGVSGSNTSLTSSSGDILINALVQGAASTQVAAQGGNLNLVGGLAFQAPNLVASASGNISGPGTVSSNNISLSSGNRLTSLTLSALQPGAINTSLNAPGDISLSGTNSMVLQGLTSTSLALSVAGDLNLVSTLTAGDLSLNLSGNLVSTDSVPDIQASNLQLSVGGNVGSSAAPLRLTGPTTVAGQVGQNAHLRTDSNLTVGTINGTVGLVAGQSALTELDVDLTHGDLVLNQQLATNNGTINIAVRDGSMSGPGTLQAGNAVIQASGSIQVFTNVNGLAATSATNNVNIVEADGLRVIGSGLTGAPKIDGNVNGISGANVSVIVNQGDLDLSDASLGNNSAIVADQVANLQALNGNIVGVNPSNRPDVTAPQIIFSASGSVGAPDVPIRITNGNQYSTTDPGYVEYFNAIPSVVPPTPSISNGVVDPTSIGLPVGTQLPTLVLKPVSGSSPGSPQGLWQVSWEAPASGPVPDQPLQRPHLLDLSLEQLLDQPAVSGYILMPLEQLLDQPVINPFLQQSLEELIAADVVTIGDGNDQPTVDNPTPQAPDGPSISLTFNPDGSIKRIYLLDLNLEQLMEQPVVSNYLHFTLQELLDTAVINPFLDNTLEQLMNTPVNPIVPQTQTFNGKGSSNAD
jgi:trimeric autotransporter adhesin